MLLLQLWVSIKLVVLPPWTLLSLVACHLSSCLPSTFVVVSLSLATISFSLRVLRRFVIVGYQLSLTKHLLFC